MSRIPDCDVDHLLVPAYAAEAPALAALELRTFHGDGPAEGRSAEDLEMHESTQGSGLQGSLFLP